MPTTSRRATKNEIKAVRAPDKAPKAASKADKAETKPQPPKATKALSAKDIERKLAAIEPGWAPAAKNRFDAEIQKGASSVKKLLAALGDTDPQVRADAVNALADLGAKEAAAALKGLLSDVSTAVRGAAALALIRLGDEGLCNEMIKGLRDASPKVVVGAATALGLAQHRPAVPYLLHAFKTTNPGIGGAVASALGLIGDPQAVEFLLTALKSGFVPEKACEALGRIGDPSAGPVLVKALGAKDEGIRASAARALGMLKDTGPRKLNIRLREQKTLPALRKRLDDSSKKVRLCAALSLYEMGDKAAGAKLVQVLET